MIFREITITDYEQLVPFWKANYFVSEMDSKDRFELFLEKNNNLSVLALENETIVGTVLGSFDAFSRSLLFSFRIGFTVYNINSIFE